MFTTVGIAAVLAVLTFARFGRAEALRTSLYNAATIGRWGYINFPDFDFEQFYTVDRLTAAFGILLWVTSVAVLAFSIFVMVKCSANIILRNSAVLFLVTGILFLLRNTWDLAYDATWLLPKRITPEYTIVVDGVLDAWVTFVLLVLVFVIGCRKQRGLWSTQQPWMTYDVNAPVVRQQTAQTYMPPPPVQQGYGPGYQ
ncbi:hypothetical protein VTN96DRAFT_9037 [Rasamsonia emersonii]|uniref:Integral membrane protein n=1 Tax=Rasamsonia emersonii (strain ATCC 16479 / CBS 393.64 / IMI 116815) TaxID=1408163 RepID=A0A0F4YJJ8_RASE3|nr:hypothetical protein T310_7585 [Rasamsonia emersonii CBS 393.64]KKA18467.1 hypothetical protein T310_7585 [Rasamsonia emersonii CBS 393.64]